MARPISTLELTLEEKTELEMRVRASRTSKRDHFRAEIILLRAGGLGVVEVGRKLGASVTSVSKWCRRFEVEGLDGLVDQEGRGRKPWLAHEKVEAVITRVTRPPKGRTRWSVRSMAREVGISHDSVHTIWKRNDLKPHLTRTFKISNDPQFEEKFWDVIGLYLDPPEKALVLCCDEKSQCQALERTQPGLPLGMGHIQTRTHDYQRHGTITLFAALNYLEGKIISRTAQKHTHVEWLRFLKQIDRETPMELSVHLILDNYCTHKEKSVRGWLDKHPRFHLHFTPTSSSWLNLVERFFADITADVVRDGSFASVQELVDQIEAYLVERNLAPKPYKWHSQGQEILAKLARAKQAMAAKATA
jgi:transposase